MGVYYECKCGNSREGDYIYRCNNCGKVYCSVCGKIGVIGEWCPACDKGYSAKTLGRIESESPEEEEEESEKEEEKKSSSDDDDDDDSDIEYNREVSEWPSSFTFSPSANVSSSSDADKSSSGNDSAEEEAKTLLLLLFAFVSIVCFAVYKGFIEKPSAPLTDNKEVTAEIAPNEVAPQQETANEAIMPNETEVPATKGVVTWIDYVDVYLEEEERLVYGTSILVRLANGAMAEVIFAVPNPTAIGAADYATLFDRGDSVILFLRGNRSDGTVKTTEHSFLETTGERVPGSKIHIQLDNGNEAFVFLDFDANLNPGERVRVISHEGM